MELLSLKSTNLKLQKKMTLAEVELPETSTPFTPPSWFEKKLPVTPAITQPLNIFEMKNYILLLLSCCSFTLQAQYQINADRLEQSLKKLQQFGNNAAGGNDRIAYSQHELDARAYLISRMEKRTSSAGRCRWKYFCCAPRNKSQSPYYCLWIIY